MKVDLVEADPKNWEELVKNGPVQRPRAELHHAALCTFGTTAICMNGGGSVFAKPKGGVSSGCRHEVPCFDFNDDTHNAIFSLDIEGFEWQFLEMRHPHVDLILIEVIQWARSVGKLDVLVELTAHLADLGYYLYEETLGFRNFLFVSQDLVNNCFAKYKSE